MALPVVAVELDSMSGMVREYCMDCHDAGTSKGDLNLETVLVAGIGDHPGIWEKVARRMGARQMPPPGEPRPDEAAYQSNLTALETFLNQRAEQKPDPGRVPAIRRLTRTEYHHAIRDLLDVEVDVMELLPKEESSHGFDNITTGSLSPTLLNRYLSAAQSISRTAVGRDPGTPQVRIVRLPADLTQEEQVDGLPPGTRGGTLLKHTFPVTGEYEIAVRLTRDRNEEVEGLKQPHELEFIIDGDKVAGMKVKPPTGPDFSKVDADLRARLKVAGGTRQVGVTFVDKGDSLLETRRQPYDASFNVHRHPRQSPAVYQISITGPFSGTSGGRTPSRDRIFVKYPASGAEELACAEAILRPLMRKAYRRPVTEADLTGPMGFYREARATGDFEGGVQAALSAILASPRFLFRLEESPSGLAPGTVFPLDGPTLASRLAFFLWSSLPDGALLDAAESGSLLEPAVLDSEVRRMLADPRAAALSTNFAGQWLQLRNLAAVSPDLRIFPDFDDNLRSAFREETERFFGSIVAEDRSILDLVRADYTFLNQRLARHYGIPQVLGSRFRRVATDAENRRGGLLRQGSILTVTSYANRTSPVIRGNWILDNILGTPTPPPPANIPALDDARVDATLPMRERLAVHRADKSCAACHNLMDPVGFALENYDATGRWRLREGDAMVNASGGLPDGGEVDGLDGLEQSLLKQPALFARTITEKLLTYALGRGLDWRDAPAIRRIVMEAAPREYRFSDIVLGIARSLPFTHRKSS